MSASNKIKKIKIHPFSFEALTSALQGAQADGNVQGSSTLSTASVEDARRSPTSPPRKPLELGNLPGEILMCIFDHLSYSDLKCRIACVCTKWNALLQSSSISGTGKIDVALYRDKPIVSNPLQPPSDASDFPESSDEENTNPDDDADASDDDDICGVQAFYEGPIWYTHPVFDVLRYRCCEPLSSFKMVYRSRANVTLQIHDIPQDLLDENAVTPAVDRLLLRRAYCFWSPLKIQGTKSNGSVTVKDILQGVITMVKDNMLDFLEEDIIAEARELIWDGVQYRDIGLRKGTVMMSYCLKSTERGY